MSDNRITTERRIHHGDNGFTRAQQGRPRLSKSDPILECYSIAEQVQLSLRESIDWIQYMKLDKFDWGQSNLEFLDLTSEAIELFKWLDDFFFCSNSVVHCIHKFDFEKGDKKIPTIEHTEILESKVEDLKILFSDITGSKNFEFVKVKSSISDVRVHIRRYESKFWFVVNDVKARQDPEYLCRLWPYVQRLSSFINRLSDYLYWLDMVVATVDDYTLESWCSELSEFPLK